MARRFVVFGTAVSVDDFDRRRRNARKEAADLIGTYGKKKPPAKSWGGVGCADGQVGRGEQGPDRERTVAGSAPPRAGPSHLRQALPRKPRAWPYRKSGCRNAHAP